MATLSRLKYEADNGQIHRILLTQEYAAQAGTPPTGAVNSSIRAIVSKTNRQAGIKPRGWRGGATVGDDDDAFTKYIFLPKLTTAAWNAALPDTLEFEGRTYRGFKRITENAD